MRKTSIVGLVSVACIASLASVACSSSSGGGTSSSNDAGSKDSGKGKTDSGKTTADSGGHTDGGGVGPHVLVTYNATASTTTPSTLFAVNLKTKAIDGTLPLADSEAITDTSNATAPYVLEQGLDTANRIDPTSWTIDGSWTVPAPAGDSGATADPYAVSITAADQLFVISYGSNDVSVFNTASGSKNPSAVVHLSGLLQPGDADGYVGATAAAYDSKAGLLYLVLGNVNLGATYTYMSSPYTLCSSDTASVVAIDVSTTSLVNLGGTAPGGGIALKGFDPSGPAGFVYDEAGSRLLILEAGCNGAPTTDAGAPGAVQQRGVEEVDLTAKTSKILLDASTQGFPGSLVYIDGAHAVVSFIYPTTSAYAWDPTSTTLGAVFANAPGTFDYDGNGNLVGANVTYGDGGAATTDIVSMSIATGKVTTLQSNVIELGMYGYVGSVGVWPRP